MTIPLRPSHNDHYWQVGHVLYGGVCISGGARRGWIMVSFRIRSEFLRVPQTGHPSSMLQIRLFYLLCRGAEEAILAVACFDRRRREKETGITEQ